MIQKLVTVFLGSDGEAEFLAGGKREQSLTKIEVKT